MNSNPEHMTVDTGTEDEIDVERELWFHKQDTERVGWIRAHADKEIERIMDWRDEEMRVVENRMAFREGKLFGALHLLGVKTKRYVHGTLMRRKLPDKVEVDEEVFFRHAETMSEHAYTTRVIQRPNKKWILQTIKSTGEELPGVTFIEGREKFSVGFSEAATYDTEIRNGDQGSEGRERTSA